jgi:hypothetical protein
MSNVHVDSYPPPERHPRTDEPLSVPDLDRLTFFHGQLLSAADLQTEQRYFREKLKLHNRCLHGFGIVCGFEVELCHTKADEEHRRRVEGGGKGGGKEPDGDQPGGRRPAEGKKAEATKPEGKKPEAKKPEGKKPEGKKPETEDEAPDQDDHPDPGCEGDGPHVRVAPGIAIDGQGNEVVLRRPVVLSLWSLLSEGDRRAARDGATVLLSVCFCEQPLCRVQPVLPETCGTAPSPAYARVRDSVRFEARVEDRHEREEDEDEACDGCCGGCGCRDGCLALARIHIAARGGWRYARGVDNGVRRMLARYEATRVAGISWRHGASYTPDDAAELLGTGDSDGGITIRFTRGVDVRTVRPGVLDVWVIDGGRGRSGNIWHMEGRFVDVPKHGYTRELRYRQTSGETVQHGDRVLVTLRGAFLLDRCCRPVAGVHVGGKVPLLPGCHDRAREREEVEGCAHPPLYPGPWTSGSDLGGTTFESWFFVNSAEREGRK